MEFATLYSSTGRPSIPPEKLLRAMLLQAFYSIRSERLLMERLEYGVSAPAGCQIIGRWRIVEADLWDRSHLDLVGPAYLQIGGDGWTEFAFGAAQAGGELEYAKTTVFFRWQGFDEGDEITGDASAELQDDGTIEIELSYDNGDDATLIGRRQ